MPQRGTPQTPKVNPATLQGRDYFEWTAKNDPDANLRKGAQIWLDRHNAASSSYSAPAPTDTSYTKIDPQTHGLPTFDHPGIQAAIAADPRLKKNIETLYNSGDSTPLDAMISAMTSGDYTGAPFSADDAKAALDKYNATLSPYFQQEREKGTADTAASLSAKKAQYDAEQSNNAIQFKQDKLNADEDAAQKGVLFSSGRVQKLKNLQNFYQNTSNAKSAAYNADVGGVARDYAYKYGSDAAANPSLSAFYNANGNTYDSMGGRGTVASSPLSTAFNPGSTNFYGTQNTAQKTAAIQGASGLLANKGNKLLGAFGQTWQY